MSYEDEGELIGDYFTGKPAPEYPLIPVWRNDPIYVGEIDVLQPEDVEGKVTLPDGQEVWRKAEWGTGKDYYKIFVAGIPIKQVEEIRVIKSEEDRKRDKIRLHEEVSAILASGAISSAFQGKMPKEAPTTEPRKGLV